MIKMETCNVFSKVPSLVLRALFQEPSKQWTANKLVKEGISLSQANLTLYTLEKLGYLQRIHRGRCSYSQVWPERVKRFKIDILKQWAQYYQFDRNKCVYLHDAKGNFLPSFHDYAHSSNVRYALTLFAAADRISAYVLNQPTALYVDIPRQELVDFSQKLQDRLGLLRLADGGNVCIASPYYGDGVFYGACVLKGHPVVSNLQLYLDLHSYPDGREQIKHLEQFFKMRGESFV